MANSDIDMDDVEIEEDEEEEPLSDGKRKVIFCLKNWLDNVEFIFLGLYTGSESFIKRWWRVGLWSWGLSCISYFWNRLFLFLKFKWKCHVNFLALKISNFDIFSAVLLFWNLLVKYIQSFFYILY